MRNFLNCNTKIVIALSVGLLLIIPEAQAQHPYLFEDYGKRLFFQLTDSTSTQDPEYIRTRVHRDLIDEQAWSSNKKQARKINMELNYEENYNTAMGSMLQLKKQYKEAVKRGVKIEYLSTSHQPKKGVYNHVYEVQTRLYYRGDSVQTMITWRYEVAYLDNFLVLFSPIEEVF